jgi:hypothetical protein
MRPDAILFVNHAKSNPRELPIKIIKHIRNR